MLIKSCCLGAVLLSTPICLISTQGQGPDRGARPAVSGLPQNRARVWQGNQCAVASRPFLLQVLMPSHV